MEIDFLRFFSAFFAGGLLSLSGSLIQGVTQNELASPSTLGLNALSVIIILICHFLLILFPNLPALEYSSFALFLAVVFPISFFAYRRKNQRQIFSNRLQHNMSFIILIGLCFNLFVGAVFSFVQFAFLTLNLSFPGQLWFGNFRFVENLGLSILIFYSLLIYLCSYKISPKIRALTFGEEFALGLGLNIPRLQTHCFILSLLSIGILNSFFGVFSFMGLVFPHMLRRIPGVRYNFSNEIRLGPILAGLVFSGLDLICYNINIYGAELPVGMLSTLIGTALLTIILISEYRKKI